MLANFNVYFLFVTMINILILYSSIYGGRIVLWLSFLGKFCYAWCSAQACVFYHYAQ